MGFLTHFQLINYEATHFGTSGIIDRRYLIKYPKLQLSAVLSCKTVLASAPEVTPALADKLGVCRAMGALPLPPSGHDQRDLSEMAMEELNERVNIINKRFNCPLISANKHHHHPTPPLNVSCWLELKL